MMKRIQRSRAKGSRLPPNCVCVTRGTEWGNPHKVLSRKARSRFRIALKLTGFYHDTAEEAVAEFRRYAEARLAAEPDWLTPLKGKDLACWCPLDGEPCHADVLLELVRNKEQS